MTDLAPLTEDQRQMTMAFARRVSKELGVPRNEVVNAVVRKMNQAEASEEVDVHGW